MLSAIPKCFCLFQNIRSFSQRLTNTQKKYLSNYKGPWSTYVCQKGSLLETISAHRSFSASFSNIQSILSKYSNWLIVNIQITHVQQIRVSPKAPPSSALRQGVLGVFASVMFLLGSNFIYWTSVTTDINSGTDFFLERCLLFYEMEFFNYQNYSILMFQTSGVWKIEVICPDNLNTDSRLNWKSDQSKEAFSQIFACKNLIATCGSMWTFEKN